MRLIRTIDEYRTWRRENDDVSLVPTMGNLHEGHLALVKAAERRSDKVVVSIFVNPLQFGEGEDFENYPRTLEEDLAKLETAGAAVAFAPAASEMYPSGKQGYFVEPPPLSGELCGKFRPDHFRGVCTVVSKLLNIVRPDAAFFGKKDYQQLVILKNMVEELNMDVEIRAVEIERDPDGLALSSRNRYLSESDRAEAPELAKALGMAVARIREGRSIPEACRTAISTLTLKGWRTDYVECRRRSDLGVPGPGDKELVILGAARLGSTRLIDNIEFDL